MTAVLIAEDEAAIREAVAYSLRQEGFDVEEVDDGERALAAARDRAFDLLVLDLMLPGRSGLDVCRLVRAESDVPILLLTAKVSEVDRVVGLELGADDYVTKPFSMRELVSRVRALLRRRALDRGVSGPARRTVGDIIVDLVAHEVLAEGRRVPVTPSEFRLVELLAREPERAYSRREILRHLWESEWVGDERACDAHIVNLRRKLERDPSRPERIVTVRGVGYKLVG